MRMFSVCLWLLLSCFHSQLFAQPWRDVHRSLEDEGVLCSVPLKKNKIPTKEFEETVLYSIESNDSSSKHLGLHWLLKYDVPKDLGSRRRLRNALQECFESTEAELKIFSAVVLTAHGFGQSKHELFLRQSLRSEDRTIRIYTIMTLGWLPECSKNRFLSSLAWRLADKEASVRMEALYVLSFVNQLSKQQLTQIKDCLADECEDCRVLAAICLLDHRYVEPSVCYPILARAIQNGIAKHRGKAVQYVGKYSADFGTKAISLLDCGLEDKVFSVRHDTLIGLAYLGPNAHAVIPGIERVIQKDDDDGNKCLAIYVLWRVDPSRITTEYLAVLENEGSSLSEAILSVIRKKRN